MTDQVLFGIMPYLKTSKPVSVRGIRFWPSQTIDDCSELADSCKAHLRALFPLFYLQNDVQISEMLCTHLHLGPDGQKRESVLRRLRESQILIGYLYCSPHFPGGEPFLAHENADLYLLRAAKVSKFLIGCEDECPEESIVPSVREDFEVDGYEGSLNWHSPVWVASGCRLYPSVPHLVLNLSQDLASDLELSGLQDYSWALLRLMGARAVDDSPARARVFTAMEWYNRSASSRVDEGMALVCLAIAFESLFGLEQGPDITTRFRDFVLGLLGRIPRLDSWVEQFYTARSKIVHQGSWQHLAFYAADSRLYRDILKGKEEGIGYRRLTSYGRRIFRLCLNAVSTGTLLAEQSGLRSLFFHNQERLETICKQLNRQDLTPELRIEGVSSDVVDLHKYWTESGDLTEVKTVIGTGKILLAAYLETQPQLPSDIAGLIHTIVEQSAGLREGEQLHQFSILAGQIARWRNTEFGHGLSSPMSSLEIVRSYAQYAAMPHLRLKTLGQP